MIADEKVATGMRMAAEHHHDLLKGRGLIGADVSKPVFSITRLTYLTLGLLVLVAATSVGGIFGIIHKGAPLEYLVVWCACGSLVVMAIVMLLLGKFMTQRALLVVEERLRRLIREDRLDALDVSVPDDLQPVMSALSQYVEQVRERMDRLRVRKKELDIQMRAAETERRNSEAIILSLNEAVLVIDAFGDLVLANAAAEEMFSFQLAARRHRPLEQILADGSLVDLIKAAREQTERGPYRHVEYAACRDGQGRTFHITLARMADPEGRPGGVVAIFHDITHERQAAQIKADFVSAVSHELRTPLSSIKAYIEMLQDGEARDETARRSFLQIIAEETARLQRLIENILNISRIESGLIQACPELIQPQTVIRTILDTLAPQAREKNVRLEEHLGTGLPSIWADRDMLHRAVLNVIGNALKYTPTGGRVRVSTDVDTERNHYVITIEDNGIGIPTGDLDRIFDKFYRSKQATAVAKGTGLGLNLVKHIVESVHQGAISVTSEPGAGTSMILRLPLSPQPTTRNQP